MAVERRSAQPNQPTSRDSDLTGKEFLDRLSAVRWNRSDFARFTGLSRKMVDRYASGRQDGRIPVLVQRALEYIERHPLELQALPEVQTPRPSLARKEALWHMQERPKPEKKLARESVVHV